MPSTRQPNFAALLGLAWLLIMLQLMAQHWAGTAQTLIDSDDAMRLAQLRDWLGGQGWYDLVQRRVQPPAGYESHWSRLIDAGLAGTLFFFGLFVEPALAERLMRTVWPMLWILPTIAGGAAIAWRIAGREAALVTLLLAVAGLPALHQFRPGRIDHHNVQIALTMLVVAATVWSDRVRFAAAAAGALTALALAIGLESLPYIAVCAAAFALRFIADRSAAQATSDYGLALAVGSVAAFFALVGPGHWTRSACDALAINWVVLAVAGGTGLTIAPRLASASMTARPVAMLVVATIAIVSFAVIEPRCLRGPYAMMDAQVWSLWMAHVREMKPLVSMLATAPVTAIAIAAFPVAALLAALIMARSPDTRRDFGFLTASAVLVVAFVTTLAAVKAHSYAIWLGVPLVAAFALHLFAALHLRRLVPRVAVGLLLTPTALSLGAITIANAAGLNDHETFSRLDREACLKNASYAPLAELTPGLIAADIDYGPFLIALTPHSVLGAPYHRLSSGIIATQDVFASPPETARGLIARLGVAYVVTCGPRPPMEMVTEPELSASLWGRLRAGDVPPWLEKVSEPGQAFSVYRVKIPRDSTAQLRRS
jgi:hypothetical protein